MKFTVLAFGVVREIFNSSSIQIESPEGSTTTDLKTLLDSQYPAVQKLTTYLIAVNSEYSPENKIIHNGDEIAIISPVSSG
jgi:molybdopterin converting factor small subunit